MWLYCTNLLNKYKKTFFLSHLFDCTYPNSSSVRAPVRTKDVSVTSEKNELLLSAAQSVPLQLGSLCSAVALLSAWPCGFFSWVFLSVFVVAVDSSGFPRRYLK